MWGSQFESNNVTVGASSLADNTWNFQGGGGIYIGNQNNPPKLYQLNDVVSIDGTSSKNYDRFFIAILEILPDGVTTGRWRALGNGGSGGWQYGQIGIQNLTEIWSLGNPGWSFNANHVYKVQVVISRNNCPSWTEVVKSFMICPNTTWGCRIGGETVEKISINPNPASSRFQLNGIDFSTDKNYTVSISDISGRQVEVFNHVTSNEFSTDNFANGVYIVNLIKDNRRLFSNKLIVNK